MGGENQNSTRQIISFSVSGILLYLSASTIRYSSAMLLWDSLIWFELKPIHLLLIKNYGALVIYTIALGLAMQWLRGAIGKEKSGRHLFRQALIFYIICFVLQFGISMLEGFLYNGTYYDLVDQHVKGLAENESMFIHYNDLLLAILPTVITISVLFWTLRKD